MSAVEGEHTAAPPIVLRPGEPRRRPPATDRWAWRHRIRANRAQLRVYRVVVGIAGLVLVGLGLLSGPIPGPGGIPLVLAGLAVLASEFVWADRLMRRLKGLLRRYRTWPRRRQVGFWIAVAAVCASIGYAVLAVLGPPPWLPDPVARLLFRLPGV